MTSTVVPALTSLNKGLWEQNIRQINPFLPKWTSHAIGSKVKQDPITRSEEKLFIC